MTPYSLNINKSMFKQIRKAVSIIILAAFISTTVKSPAYAQAASGRIIPYMPQPGIMVHLSPEFTPAYLKGIVVHPENALKFDFIIYKGDTELTDAQKKDEYLKLAKYFLASLAIPDDDQWVNLSPYEKDRIIKDDFGKTEMGRDLLAQDYMLKQITASLIYPESNLGKKFWDKVYTQAQAQYGTTSIPVNTFNKVWIVPDDAEIYEKGNTAYVFKSHLKVMMEEDYLSLQKHSGIQSAPMDNKTHTIASKIVKEIVLPELEIEVNEGKNFAALRQMFSGMVLATWYKQALKESLLSKIYADKAKVKGVDQNPQNNEQIYRQYLKAYKKGVFNFIKEDVDKYTKETIPRKYFSGGFVKDIHPDTFGPGDSRAMVASKQVNDSQPELEIVPVLTEEAAASAFLETSHPSGSLEGMPRTTERSSSGFFEDTPSSNTGFVDGAMKAMPDQDIHRVTQKTIALLQGVIFNAGVYSISLGDVKIIKQKLDAKIKGNTVEPDKNFDHFLNQIEAWNDSAWDYRYSKNPFWQLVSAVMGEFIIAAEEASKTFERGRMAEGKKRIEEIGRQRLIIEQIDAIKEPDRFFLEPIRWDEGYNSGKQIPNIKSEPNWPLRERERYSRRMAKSAREQNKIIAVTPYGPTEITERLIRMNEPSNPRLVVTKASLSALLGIANGDVTGKAFIDRLFESNLVVSENGEFTININGYDPTKSTKSFEELMIQEINDLDSVLDPGPGMSFLVPGLAALVIDSLVGVEQPDWWQQLKPEVPGLNLSKRDAAMAKPAAASAAMNAAKTPLVEMGQLFGKTNTVGQALSLAGKINKDDLRLFQNNLPKLLAKIKPGDMHDIINDTEDMMRSFLSASSSLGGVRFASTTSAFIFANILQAVFDKKQEAERSALVEYIQRFDAAMTRDVGAWPLWTGMNIHPVPLLGQSVEALAQRSPKNFEILRSHIEGIMNIVRSSGAQHIPGVVADEVTEYVLRQMPRHGTTKAWEEYNLMMEGSPYTLEYPGNLLRVTGLRNARDIAYIIRTGAEAAQKGSENADAFVKYIQNFDAAMIFFLSSSSALEMSLLKLFFKNRSRTVDSITSDDLYTAKEFARRKMMSTAMVRTLANLLVQGSEPMVIQVSPTSKLKQMVPSILRSKQIPKEVIYQFKDELGNRIHDLLMQLGVANVTFSDMKGFLKFETPQEKVSETGIGTGIWTASIGFMSPDGFDPEMAPNEAMMTPSRPLIGSATDMTSRGSAKGQKTTLTGVNADAVKKKRARALLNALVKEGYDPISDLIAIVDKISASRATLYELRLNHEYLDLTKKMKAAIAAHASNFDVFGRDEGIFNFDEQGNFICNLGGKEITVEIRNKNAGLKEAVQYFVPGISANNFKEGLINFLTQKYGFQSPAMISDQMVRKQIISALSPLEPAAYRDGLIQTVLNSNNLMDWIDQRIGSLPLMISQEQRAIDKGSKFGSAEMLTAYTQELGIFIGLRDQLQKVDRASITPTINGGIDFNSANLNLQIKRDGKGVPLPISQQNLENIHIDGLVPVILDIRPAASTAILAELMAPVTAGTSSG